MEEQFQKNSKSHKTTIVVIVVALVTAIVIGGLVFAYQQTIIQKKELFVSKQIINLHDQSEKIIEQIQCNGEWDDTVGCIKRKINLQYPNNDEMFGCNEDIEVKWSAIESNVFNHVRIALQHVNGFETLDKVDASEGAYTVNTQTLDVWENDGYKIRVSLEKEDGAFIDENVLFDTSNKFFIIEKCEHN